MFWAFPKIRIRTSILANILFVVFLVSVGLIFLQYHFSHRAALEATRETFRHIADKVAIHMRDKDRLVRTLLSQVALYPRIRVEPKREGLPPNALRFAETMKRNKRIYSMYVGFPNGDLFEVASLQGDPVLLKGFRAPSGAHYLVIRVYKTPSGRVRKYDFYDKRLRWLSQRRESTSYDARKRPWYTQARTHAGTVRSLPYLFSFLGKRGITYSRAVDVKGTVAAIDFTLEEVDDILKKQVFAPTAEIFMFDKGGDVIASSSPSKESLPLILQVLDNTPPGRVVILRQGEKEKFVMFKPLTNEVGEGVYLGFSVDADIMMEPYLRNLYLALAAASLFLVLSVPFVFNTTSRIVRPIRALMKENEKVRERRFGEVAPVETNIIELMELSDSLVSMSHSIQEYERSLEEMIHSFIKLIADAIDAKSPHTGGHCKRVPVLALELTRVAEASEEGPFANFRFKGEDDRKAFEMGAWLHDCGKITTPEFVVDKATKLETIYNRIHEVRTRFEVIWRDVDIAFYERLLEGEDRETLEKWRKEEKEKLMDDFAFVARCNLGDEFMDGEKKARLHRIARRTWVRHFSNRLGISQIEMERFGGMPEPPLPVTEFLLADRPEHLVPRGGFDEERYRERGFKLDVPELLYNFGEIYNLSIPRGTLTPEEIFKIREHVIMTIEMLEALPYPEGLKNIPKYGGTHHETLDGTGYPRGLRGEELSIPARIMAIADIFEALTASDRPYKKGKTLSQTLRIMGLMVKEGHLDRDLFFLFLKSGIYRDYAEKYLKPYQIDTVNLEELLGKLG